MELLVYNKRHWYDTTTDKRRAELDNAHPGKFAGRYQRGDIVETYPDGFWDTKGFNRKAFCLVRIPGMIEDRTLMKPLMDGDVELKKRRYALPEVQLIADEIEMSMFTLLAVKVEKSGDDNQIR